MGNFTFDYAYGVGCWCAAALWGVFTVLFIICLWLVRRTDGLKRVQVIAVIALYILGTASVALGLATAIQGFILTSTSAARLAYFSNVAQPLIVANTFIYIIMLCISDLVLVWRCWLVWNKKWVIAMLPILMVVGQVAAGCGAVGQYLGPNMPGDYAIRPWATAMYAMSLATNITLSLLIAGRLWWVMRASSQYVVGGRHGTYGALRLVIESGLAITSAKIIEFVLFQMAFLNNAQNEAIFVMYLAMPQILGIIPTLIILSIQTGVSPAGVYSVSTTAGSSTAPPSTAKRTLPRRGSNVYGQKVSSEMPTVSVETATYKDTDDSDVELASRRATGSSIV
ncbi:hypothetical protein CALVIDRAFT_197970 [Calocera viscosa TUFC12733]|uniref:Uncharacterized protein n=1 Tax=Calocera viscosa (strain TUFC12733) TaxID=1330018 RepID=A0A167KJG3_CALVF|nr:hypothetical protein CALVIDRAFT_197970 [Calocera viscosa TUFC12733]